MRRPVLCLSTTAGVSERICRAWWQYGWQNDPAEPDVQPADSVNCSATRVGRRWWPAGEIQPAISGWLVEFAA